MIDERFEIYKEIMIATSDVRSNDDEWKEYQDKTGVPLDEIPEEFRPKFEVVDNNTSTPSVNPLLNLKNITNTHNT